jgi:hypothetical protein
MVHHEVLGLFLKPDVSLIADDLVLDLLDSVLAGLVVVNVDASDPSVVLFCLGLAKGINAVVHSSSLNPPPTFFVLQSSTHDLAICQILTNRRRAITRGRKGDFRKD